MFLGGSCPISSGNEKEVSVMGRLGFLVFPLWTPKLGRVGTGLCWPPLLL